MSDVQPAADASTEEELAYVESLWDKSNLSGGENNASKAAIQYTPRQANRLMRSKRVQQALHEKRQAAINTELATEALGALKDLLGKATPPQVRLGAVKLVMELAGHTADSAGDGKKRLDEMTAEELAAFVGSIDRTLAERGKAAVPLETLIAQAHSA